MPDLFNADFLLILSGTEAQCDYMVWAQIVLCHCIRGMKAHVRPKFYGLAHTCKPWTMPHRIVAALPCRNETHSLTVTASNKDGPRFGIGHSQLGNGDSMHGSRSDNSFRSMTDGVKASSILRDEVSLYTILQCAAHSVWYSAP